MTLFKTKIRSFLCIVFFFDFPTHPGSILSFLKLRSNSYTIKFIFLKLCNHRFLIVEHFYHPRNLVLIGSHFLFPFSSCPWQSLNYFLSLDLPTVGIPYRWNLIILGLLCQASFTYVFKAYPCCSMYQYFNSTQDSYSALRGPAQLGIPTSSAVTLPPC